MKNLIIVILVLACSNIYAQRRFETFKETENLVFSYRYKKECFLKKDSPLQLVLHIRNNNTEAVKLNFKVFYYWQLQSKAESEKISLCIKPGRVKRGGRADLVFTAADFTNEQLRSEDFTFDIPDLEIEKVSSCR